jgi:hypothetical protein
MLLHKLDMSEEIKGGDFEVLTPNTVHDRPFNASTNTVGSAEKYKPDNVQYLSHFQDLRLLLDEGASDE